MKIHCFGDPKDPVLVLLHPMLLNGQVMIESIGKKLQGSYYMIATDQAGHGEDDSLYSPRDDAEELKKYLLEHGFNEIELLYAASMGGLTAMELIKLGGIRYHSVHLDGIPLAPIKGFNNLFARITYQFAWNKARKDPSSFVSLFSSAYGDENGAVMAAQFGKLSKQNLKRVLDACAAGCAVTLTEDQCPHMIFDWGSKEINYRQGKPLAEKLYPWAKHIVRENFGHCEYLGKKPDSYALELTKEVNCEGSV